MFIRTNLQKKLLVKLLNFENNAISGRRNLKFETSLLAWLLIASLVIGLGAMGIRASMRSREDNLVIPDNEWNRLKQEGKLPLGAVSQSLNDIAFLGSLIFIMGGVGCIAFFALKIIVSKVDHSYK